MNNILAPEEKHDFMAEVFKHMNPSSLQTLRQLDLRLDLSLDNEPHDPLMGLPEGLARMPAGNNLREISITISVCEFRECSTRSRHWEPLDEVLGDRSRFALLQKVQVLITPSIRGQGKLLMDMSAVCFSRMRSIYGKNFTFQLKL